MIRKFLTTILLLMSFSQFCDCASAADIVLRESANPLGTVVRLGDVAEIRTTDEAESDQLSAIPLMPTPATGTVQHLRAKEIRDMLRAQGINWNVHRFSGAISVKVGRESYLQEQTQAPVVTKSEPKVEDSTPVRRPPSIGFRSINNAEQDGTPNSIFNRITSRQEINVKIRVRKSLEAWLASQGEAGKLIAIGEIEVDPIDVERLHQYRQRELIAEPLAYTTATPGTGKFVVAPVAGQPSYAKAELIQLVQVVTCSRTINRGQMITASHIILKSVLPQDAEKSFGQPLENIDLAIGRIASRTIQNEELVTDKNTTTPILVKRRETVTVSTGSTGITIRMQAVAKQDGRMGDLITVETLDTGELLQARVTGRSELAVLGAGQFNSQLAARTSLGGYQ